MIRGYLKVAVIVLLALGNGVFDRSVNGQNCEYAFHDSFNSAQWGNGQAVDVSNDVLAIGAPSILDGDESSRAFLIRVSDGTLIHELQDPSPDDSIEFGSSVAISSNGSQVLVGDPGDNTFASGAGQVYLYDTVSGQLEFTFNIPLEDTQLDFGGRFGASVAFSDDYIVVGASNVASIGRVYLFDRQSNQLIDTFDDPAPAIEPDLGGLRDFFGASVKVHANLLVVGSPFDRTLSIFAGDAHIFDLETRQRLETIRSPMLDPGLFGTSVDISDKFIAVGARLGGIELSLGPGIVHLFDTDTFKYIDSIEIPNPGIASFGNSVALFGSRLVVGAHLTDGDLPDVGQAFVYDATDGALLQTLNDPNPVASDYFGFSVANDGDTIAVGSGEVFSGVAGDVHLFQLEFLLGDVNRDGDVNLLDVSVFVDLLSSGDYQCEADLNGDQSVDLLDVVPFVEKLQQS